MVNDIIPSVGQPPKKPEVSLEAIMYDLYFRSHGIRRYTQIDRPVISDMSQAELPKEAIYHYNPEGPGLLGPMETNSFLRNTAQKHIKHITQFAFEPEGMIVRKVGNTASMIQLYRRRHRTLRLLRDFFMVNKQPNHLIVYNYCLLNALWRYRNNKYTPYYQFMNFYKNIIMNMDKLASQSERQQFFEVRMPEKLYSRADLALYTREMKNGITNRLLHAFPNDDAWLFFHLWLWVGKNPEYSLFNKIQTKHLKKINLILTESGKYTVINLGILHEWRKEDEENDTGEDLETDEGVDAQSSNQLQYKFYRMIVALFGYRTSPPKPLVDVPVYSADEIKQAEADGDNFGEEDPEDVEQLPSEKQEEQEEEIEETLDDVVIAPKVEKPEEVKDTSLVDDVKVIAGMDTGNEANPKYQDDYQQANDTSVNKAVSPVLKPKVILIDEEVNTDGLSSELVMGVKDRLTRGELSPREYRKTIELMKTFKELPDPYGSEMTVEEMVNIPQETIHQFKKQQIPDNDWVLDKSMLEASAEEMDREYIKKLLPRNNIQAIMKLQNAGIIVKDIQREEYKDPVSHYEILKVAVQPIGGRQSTLEIKLPIPDEEGNILINGTKSFIRKTRMDKPIRKTAPDKVKLTSAYGKIFINKADRSTFNLTKHVQKHLQAKIIDGIITNVKYKDSFDPALKFHPHYAIFAKRFLSFDYQLSSGAHVDCYFNYPDRHLVLQHEFDEDTEEQLKVRLEQIEGDVNRILIGHYRDGGYLFFNNQNGMIENTFGEQYAISDFFGFPASQGEMVETEIGGKPVPLVMILGYHLGLSTLCRKLNVKPRKYFPRQHMNLTSHDYVIRFADEIWVFDRRDYQAHLIINGLNQYKRYLTDYSVTQFEESDVYMALMRDAGVPLSVEAEIRRQPALFIDDITASILKQMGEPTDYMGLLFRAVELLTTSWSRPEINMEDMLIVGYQRIANHVYKELVNAVKEAERGGSKARERFGIQPTRIFQSIMSDSVTTLVDDINPIHNLKEHDNVTFNGDGGRSRRSMVSHTRSYDKTDLGVISEATVDNQDVGITTFLTGNANINSLYGITSRVDEDKAPEAGNVFSSSTLLGVALDTDDQQQMLSLL